MSKCSNLFPLKLVTCILSNNNKGNLSTILHDMTDNSEALREAASYGDLEAIRALIDSGRAEVNNRNKVNGWTALHWAAKRNHLNAVEELLAKGADKTLFTSKVGLLPAAKQVNVSLLLLLFLLLG